MLLNVKDLKIHYDKAEVVKGVSLSVAEGTVVGILGANGAGKSTIMKAISGLKRPTSGEIWFKDTRIDKIPTHKIVELGLIQIPEGRKLFPYMSVLANLKLGAFLRKDKQAINRDLERVFERFPRLKERKNQLAGLLSGGEQQMVAIARGLMADPKLLLLDEPSLGLAPIMVEELGKAIKGINKDGVSILLVEQNAGLATELCDIGFVLTVGEIVTHGKMKDLMTDDLVCKSFLGR